MGLEFEKWAVRAVALVTLALAPLSLYNYWSELWQGTISFGATLALVSHWARRTGHRGGRKMSGNGTATRKHTSWLDWIQPVGTILQTVAVLVGIGFAIYELNQARQAYQAATVSDIHGRTAELQWRVIDDPNLAPLLLDPATPEAKRAVIAGIVINEFATMFDLWKLGGIPDRAWEGFEKDIVSTMSTEYFSSRWRQVRRQHGSEFRGYIDEILGLGEE